MGKELFFHRLGFAGIIILALGIFTSVSFSALSHVLLLPTGLFFFYKWIKGRDFEIPMDAWALIAVIFACWLSVVFNLDILQKPFKNALKTKYFIIGFLSLFSFYYLNRDFLDDKKRKLILNLFLFATSVATISGLIALKTGFNPLKMKDACHPTRACGLYGMYMTYGYGISLFMILVSGMIVQYRKIKHLVPMWFLSLVWLINFAGLIFSFARGAWLGFILALPFLFFKKHKKGFLITGLCGVVLLGSAFLGSEKVRNVFTKRQGSNEQRIAFYHTAYMAFKEKPVFGWGYRNFEANSKQIKIRHKLKHQHFGGHAHNNLLEHLASTGGLGFLVTLAFMLLWMVRTYYQSETLFAFTVSFFISGMVQYTFGDGENLFLIMAIFSMPSFCRESVTLARQ